MNRQRTISAFKARLSRLPVARHPAMRFNPWVEGYRQYLFGGRAGPSISIRSLFHELAHAAQFQGQGADAFSKRAVHGTFRFHTPTAYICGHLCDEPTTNQATLRELDTFAHQLLLMRAAGLKVDEEEFFLSSGKLMRFMSDWWHVPGGSEPARAQWCAERIPEYVAKLSTAEVLARLEAWLDDTRKHWGADEPHDLLPTQSALEVYHCLS